MNNISIIGAGRLGTSLGAALLKKGFKIKALSCKTLSSAKKSRDIIGQGDFSTNNIQTARSGDIVILSVPDDEIEKVVKELVSSDLKWPKKFVFHCSGLLPSDILRPLKAKGALIGSVHPIQSFSQKNMDLKTFEGIYFGLEGNKEAIALSLKIVHKLGSHSIIIKAKDKSLYHAASSIASNFFVVQLDAAVFLLEQLGIQEDLALQILLPLVKGTLHSVKKFKLRSSLTGPVIRGDYKSIKMHLEALRSYPPYYETYQKLAVQALEIAKRENRLSHQKIKALKTLLEEK